MRGSRQPHSTSRTSTPRRGRPSGPCPMLLGDQLGRRPRGGFVVVMESFVPARIEPTYRPSGEQRQIVLYAGDLDVKLGDQTRRVKGQLELRLAAGPLVARFAGPPSDALQFAGAHEATASVSVPVGASLVPPLTTMLPKVGSDMDWIEARIPIRSELSAGELAHVRRFIFHISGALKASSFPRTEVLGGGSQQQLRFRLPGWDLVIAPVDDPAGERDFAVVVDARPVTPATGVEVEMSIDRLISRLFILLHFEPRNRRRPSLRAQRRRRAGLGEMGITEATAGHAGCSLVQQTSRREGAPRNRTGFHDAVDGRGYRGRRRARDSTPPCRGRNGGAGREGSHRVLGA